MADTGATCIARLAAIVGASNVFTDPADLAPYLVDWRGRYHGAAAAVVRPRSTAEVAEVVRTCGEAGVGIVPQGGNTGMCGGATPRDRTEIVLSTALLDRIRAIDEDNATITAEAGVTLARLHEAAGGAALRFPLSLASEGSCTIGGNLSTNAGGTAVLRFGNARDLVLGLEVVLPDGRVLDMLRGLRKDNTGYDLKQCFVGAEGTLGIVTAAVLKGFPAARAQATALAAVRDVGGAVALLRRLRQSLGDRLTGFELMNALSLGLARKHHPALPDVLPGHAWYALVQVDDSAEDPSLGQRLEDALVAAGDAGLLQDATVAQSLSQAQALWALRENISEAQRREGPNIKHDISLPVSSIAAFVDEAARTLEHALPGVRFVTFGHLGDGNLHYNLSGPEGVDADAFMAHQEAANRIVHDLVASRRGSFSAEHGIGQLKRDELVHYRSAVELDVMRRIKAALDPRGIMNPGKVL